MKRTVLLCLLWALASGTGLFAQDISASIGGVVVDPTGAAVPGAKVTVTNTERNQVVRTVTTDATGSYSAPIIPIGTYTIAVEANGFKTVSRKGIVLNVNDNRVVNVTLEVGSVTESVTVQEAPVAVELGTPASSTTVEGTQIRELSLGTRNYEQLVMLMPGVTSSPTDQLYIGVSSPSGTAATIPFSVNGQRNSANNWTVDGADNVDRGSNLTLLTFPSVDAIDQFKVLRSLYTADTGRAGGAQINVVTKSGTKDFHGTLYEFIRNDAFAANNWINNANRVNVINGKATPPPLRWNDFGGTFGGPIYVPGKFNQDRNKTFFFYSQEFRRIITYTTFSPTLPNASWLQGTFATPVCIDYSSGVCHLTSTQVPSIDPIAQQYIKDIFSKLPIPTSGTLVFSPQRNVYNHRQELLRIDHTFNEKFSVWGKFLDDSIPTVEPGGLFTGSNIPNGAITHTNAPGRSFVIHALNSVRSNMLNEVGYNFSRGAILSTPAGITSKENSPDINVNLPFPSTQGVVPTIGLTGGSSIIGYGPYTEYNRNHAFFDNFSWIRGRHTLKFGLTVNRYQKTENAAGNNGGTFSFTQNGVPSGTTNYAQAFANFLLGNVSTFTQNSMDITPNLWAWQNEAYAQDDFRVRSNLTLYFGVRWSYFGQPSDSNGLLDNFNPGMYSAADAPKINPANGLIVAGTGNDFKTNGIIVGGKNSPWGDKIAPVGKKNFAPRIGVSWDPFGTGKTAIRAGYGVYYDATLFGIYEQNIFTNPPYVQSVSISNTTLQNPGGGTVNISSSPLVLRGTPLPYNTPYTQHWSFNIQQQLAKDVVLEIGYFGSKGTHLPGIVDINQAYPGAALAAGLHTGAAGTTIFTSSDTPRINAVRPYLGFNAINTIQTAFDSNYHSLQTNVRKSFGAAGLIGGAFTWSKNLTDNASDRSTAPQNSYNWHDGEYGPATLDRKLVLTVNYVYHLPFFKNSKGLVGGVLGGWELSGITSYYSGAPLTVTTSSVDPAGLGLLGASAASSRPDMLCDPNANAPHQVGLNSPWFSTSCFAAVQQGAVRPGNAGRGVVRAPGFGKWDVTLLKNFALGEHRSLQLRGETYNLLNHGNPGAPVTSFTSTLFGQITSFRDPRLIQLGAKLYF